MRQSSDSSQAVWSSLDDRQCAFLLAAYSVDRQLPHSDGLCKVLPAIRWRTIGVRCGLQGHEADEVVATLADIKLVLVMDAEERTMGLICGHLVRAVFDARRKRWWDRATAAATVLTVLVEWWRLSRH